MKHITHIITGLHVGGAETMLYRLTTQLNTFRHSVISLIPHGAMAALLEAHSIPVYSLNLPRGKLTPQSVYRLIQLVRHLRPDILQGWMYHGNLAAHFAHYFMKPSLPVIWNIRNSLDPSEHLTPWDVRSWGKYVQADCLIFNSQTSAALHQNYGYHAPIVKTIPNGFDTEIFRPDSTARHLVRQELRLPENVLVVGMVANYSPLKGHANFLQAARSLRETYIVLVGHGVDEKNNRLMQLISDLGLSERCRLLGQRHDIARLMVSFDVLVSASYTEAFSNVIGEAMACGVPCVVTDVGDSAYMVGETGLVVPPRDAAALALACQQMTTMNRLDLGLKARERVIKLFGLPAIVSQYETLYAMLLAYEA